MFQTCLFDRDSESNENSNHSSRTGLTSDMRNMNRGASRTQDINSTTSIEKKSNYGTFQIIIELQKKKR
jgi:hypothetical protein